ncbi:hypothetical protein ZHAS_00011076 [Anopheles sinensis]|uniref:Uncharacterized protein n=1 Tax=Anopheles sinensis TaxID=74873 RepID=A0A084VZ97_ANOSI|nr:hypothetical protein ZHAS_00011076 [Anopheles sinensis]
MNSAAHLGSDPSGERYIEATVAWNEKKNGGAFYHHVSPCWKVIERGHLRTSRVADAAIQDRDLVHPKDWLGTTNSARFRYEGVVAKVGE